MNENHDSETNHELDENYRSFNAYRQNPNPKRTYAYDEEFSTDLLDRDSNFSQDATSGSVILGFIGLVATIVALFHYSFLIGAIGVILGCYAVAKGAKILGVTTICIGILALAFQLVGHAPLLSFL